MSVESCKAFIETYLAEYGQDPECWAVDAMAADLDGRLEGESPENMRAQESLLFFDSWLGKVVNAAGGLVDYARFLTYADAGIMSVISAGGLAGIQETFECYAALHRGRFGVDFPLWTGAF